MHQAQLMSGDNSYYVCALKDPRTSPALPFYIGQGTGVRSHAHLVKPDGTRKGSGFAQLRRVAQLLAQLGLALLKDAVLELAEVNPKGISNSDAAGLLGLRSDYAGGSKDYLSYSVLGILMREGKLERSEESKKMLPGLVDS